MRYHKVTAISSPEASFILATAWVSLNPFPVMSVFDRWFDIRRMTAGEVSSFAEDWMREAAANVAAGRLKPH
jgi:hypothetical protein